jgi:hypothetical protein
MSCVPHVGIIVEMSCIFVGKHVTPPRRVAIPENTESKQRDAASGSGRLHNGYCACPMRVFIVLRRAEHVETTVIETATSGDHDHDDRGNQEGEGAKDYSHDNRCYP